MNYIKLIKNRNDSFLITVKQLNMWLNSDVLMSRPHDVWAQLSKLFGGLRVHLMMSEKVFYPRLLSWTSERAQYEIKDMHEQVRELTRLSALHTAKWLSVDHITASPAEFALETKALLFILNKHIKAECEQIYPMLDIA